ncbi:MAG: phosphoribosylanthranilate isomerase [Eubacterium sp.]|nr:phosphoribosylanthranilate isomerase [Eubacterium sp.]
MARVKMCGMMRPEDIEIVNELRPDYIGFVFASFSKRYVSYETARKLKEMLDPSIKAVGVFVDENPKIVASVANEDLIDLIQVHGSEGPGEIERIKAFTTKTVIQAVKIHTKEDVEIARQSPADGILLDSGMGSGETFNWGLLELIRRPYMLAGGLTPENVAEAIRRCHPFAVDVSSGIETDGKKDRAKMEAFMQVVRQTK